MPSSSAAALACAALLLPAAAFGQVNLTIDKSLPHVGIAKSFDPTTSTLTLLGPDGKETAFTVRADQLVMQADDKPIPWDKFLPLLEPGREPQHMAVFPREAGVAHIVAKVFVEEPEPSRLVRVVEPELTLHFNAVRGFQMRLKPAVNLGAAETIGGPPTTASWAWFDKKLNAPLAIRTFDILGFTYLWSLEPFDPATVPKPKTIKMDKP